LDFLGLGDSDVGGRLGCVVVLCRGIALVTFSFVILICKRFTDHSKEKLTFISLYFPPFIAFFLTKFGTHCKKSERPYKIMIRNQFLSFNNNNIKITEWSLYKM